MLILVWYLYKCLIAELLAAGKRYLLHDPLSFVGSQAKPYKKSMCDAVRVRIAKVDSEAAGCTTHHQIVRSASASVRL